MFNSFIIALQFLTRIPINVSINYSNQRLGQSVLFYPVIGLLIGALLLALANVLPPNNNALNAALILSLWVAITGGLHLDGLADCTDAWAGGLGDKARTLAIMKDPAAGPIAVIYLVLVLLLKWTALQSLLDKQIYALPLLIAPLLGRLSIIILMLTSPYVSENGLANTLLNYLPKRGAQIITLSLLLLCAWFSVWAMLPYCLLILLIRYLALHRLQGVTGDVYGASVELSETVFIISWVLFYG